ncbi:hypothetical protein D1Y84_00935 [Acidipila sp. EB88]|nr:hypothetical protein D1Y84_00935 [Acidipila sp. EB88]
MHITATIHDCLPAELRQNAQAAITGTERLMKHPEVKPLLRGHFASFEYSVPAQNPTHTSCHTHTLAAFAQKTGTKLPSAEQWSSWWLTLSHNNRDRDIQVNAIPRQDTFDVAAYATKNSEYADRPARKGFITRWSEALDDPDRFLTEIQALKSKRRYFGTLARPRNFVNRQGWTAPWDRAEVN